jgi:hypothetical protein
MCVPGLATDKATFGMLDQASDHMDARWRIYANASALMT